MGRGEGEMYRSADCTEQNGIRVLRGRESLIRQGGAGGIDRGLFCFNSANQHSPVDLVVRRGGGCSLRPAGGLAG